MIPIAQTALDRLEREGRLQNPMFKAETYREGRFGFRGSLVLETIRNIDGANAHATNAPSAGSVMCTEAFTVGKEGSPTLPFFAGRLSTFAHLRELSEALAGLLKGGGKYFVFCADLPPDTRCQVPFGGALWYALPIATGSVYNELVSLLYLDGPTLKKCDPAAKLDAITDAAIQYDVTFDMLTYTEGVERAARPRMTAVRL